MSMEGELTAARREVEEQSRVIEGLNQQLEELEQLGVNGVQGGRGKDMALRCEIEERERVEAENAQVSE